LPRSIFTTGGWGATRTGRSNRPSPRETGVGEGTGDGGATAVGVSPLFWIRGGNRSGRPRL
jgi:hypothetical protein